MEINSTNNDNYDCLYTRAQALNANILEILIYYKRQKNQHKLGTIIVNAATIIASGLSTILIGWHPSKGDDMSHWALVTSTIATAMILLNNLFDYKNVWIIFKVAILDLKLLKGKLNSSCPLSDQKLTELESEYNKICEQVNKEYRAIRAAAKGIHSFDTAKKGSTTDDGKGTQEKNK